MKISEAGGETGIISLIARNYGLSGYGDGFYGIGDDCAVIPNADGSYYLVTCDMLCEGTHFDLNINTYSELGYKSAAVNVSDIAGMGGRPLFAFISLGVPDIDIEDIENFYVGLNNCFQKYGVVILGGDTVKSKNMVINVTLIGKSDIAPIMRDTASIGDLIFVCGNLGDSAAGLDALLRLGYTDAYERYPYLVNKHLKPEPCIKAGESLLSIGGVTAMMDISDGLSKDLKTLISASDVGADIYFNRIPVSEELLAYADSYGLDSYKMALCGGEEYGLLFTCKSNKKQSILFLLEYLGVKASVIGEITAKGLRIISEDGDITAMPEAWEHF